jgi:hypothetical protein
VWNPVYRDVSPRSEIEVAVPKQVPREQEVDREARDTRSGDPTHGRKSRFGEHDTKTQTCDSAAANACDYP